MNFRRKVNLLLINASKTTSKKELQQMFHKLRSPSSKIKFLDWLRRTQVAEQQFYNLEKTLNRQNTAGFRNINSVQRTVE